MSTPIDDRADRVGGADVVDRVDVLVDDRVDHLLDIDIDGRSVPVGGGGVVVPGCLLEQVEPAAPVEPVVHGVA